MTQRSGVILCLAYILGLLSTAFVWGDYGVLALGIGVAVFFKSCADSLPSNWRGIKPAVWLVAGVIGLLATLYFQTRVPQPAANDISKFVTSVGGKEQQIVIVQGKVTSTPHLTRNGRMQLWLEATQLDSETSSKNSKSDSSSKVTGKLYVTLPLQPETSIYPGQAIAITGFLYKPKPATSQSNFDFQAYLAKEGTFAGLKGIRVNLLAQKTPQWGWWSVRRRIINAQMRWLGNPEGPLLSAIVLGHQAVDLPHKIQDQFIQIGLAHAIVASGFKVSLILGLLLALSRRLSQKVQFCLGTAALIIYVGLTGFHPPVLRATIMGFGALIALVLQRKRKPLNSLLVAATLLLLIQPLWIWDVGFELSFLATFGLMITVQPLVQRLDWLPPAIASLVAVPIAAYLWTLPLLLHVFNVLAPYSIVVNTITTPLLSTISVGGIISAIAALIWPLAGSAVAWLLYYPTHLLIAVVQFFCQLPGNSFSVTTISVLQLSILYGLICLAWLQPWWQQRWWLATIMAIGVVSIPVWLANIPTA